MLGLKGRPVYPHVCFFCVCLILRMAVCVFNCGREWLCVCRYVDTFVYKFSLLIVFYVQMGVYKYAYLFGWMYMCVLCSKQKDLICLSRQDD